MSVNKVSKISDSTPNPGTLLDKNSSCRRSARLAARSKLAQVSPVARDASASVVSGNPAQKTAVPIPEGPKDSTVAVASLLKEIEQTYSDSPVYHIRLDGYCVERKQSGEKCILCAKDLSCSPNDVERADDEYKYRVKFIPLHLPAVDILPCGHGIHTECSKYAMSAESNVPQCVLCLSMP
ncbi:putative transcription factor C2H2 family [Helianthus anomalus]